MPGYWSKWRRHYLVVSLTLGSVFPAHAKPSDQEVVRPAQLAHATFRKLDQVKVGNLEFHNEPLAGALAKVTQSLRAEALEIGSVVTNNVYVTISPALRNVALQEALAAIANGADKPIAYEVTAQGVIRFRDSRPQLITKTYSIHLDRFRKELEWKGIAIEENKAFRQTKVIAGGIKWEIKEITTWVITPALKKYFATHGIQISEPVEIAAVSGTLVLSGDALAHQTIDGILKPFLPTEQEEEAQRRKAAENQPLELFSRTYSTDPKISVPAIRNWAAAWSLKAGEKAIPEDLNKQLRSYFRQFGIAVVSPHLILLDERDGTIHVRATLPELHKIEAAIQELTTVAR